MIQFRNLTLARGAQRLVETVSLQIHTGYKVALTGANGSGKSSLFALLYGELHQESGELDIPPTWVIAHVAQETPATADSAMDFTLDGDAELRAIERDIVAAEAVQDGTAVGELHARLRDIDGYSARSRAASLLHGLGFTNKDFSRPVSTFSGGWRVRLNLARALMCRSDLLLLDEPTNHLDLAAVIWLESWLKNYRGTLITISHDRDFVDNVVDHVAHIENQRLTLYRGTYSDFERQRAERLAQQQLLYERQQRKIAHIHSYIDRFRAKATKARQAQSRIKALERMELISAAYIDNPFSFSFRDPLVIPDPLLVLDDGAIGYGGHAILSKLALTLRPGDRLGLLGMNGAGKSTLIKLLAGDLMLMSGKRIAGKELNIGYFAQHQLEHLQPQQSPLQHMVRLDPKVREQDFRDYLGRFDFCGDMVTTPCISFSGGEKSRLALALIIWQRPNLLLLDEPTNHLDLEMRHSLTLALQEYGGGIVLASHDRALLRATCDRFVMIAEGTATPFDGDLEDYQRWLTEQNTTDPQTEKSAEKMKLRAVREQHMANRQASLSQRRALVKEVKQLDKNMERWQIEKATLDNSLAETEIYQDTTQLQLLLKRHAALSSLIEKAEERWLEIHEALESFPMP